LSEKDVVMNERRFRVEDDIEGTAEEQLWKTAFERHPYHWPTLGWMQDIEGLTTDDCREFYQRYYAPNNASLVLVGDLNEQKALTLISEAYGKLAPSVLPIEDLEPEAPQTEERHVELNLPTETEKLFLGFKSPAVGDANHVVASLLIEILCGGPASRLSRRLVRHDQIASDVGGFIGPHRDPSLMEISVAARKGVRAEALRAAIDEELTRIQQEAIPEAELNRAKARMELGLLGGLESADGKASTIGFYQTLLGRPAAAFERMEELERLTSSDLLRVARSILHPRGCTSVIVRKTVETSPALESSL
jgi:zinc protease